MSEIDDLQTRVLGLEAQLRALNASIASWPGLVKLNQNTEVNGDLTVEGAINGTISEATHAASASALSGTDLHLTGTIQADTNLQGPMLTDATAVSIANGGGSIQLPQVRGRGTAGLPAAMSFHQPGFLRG